MSDELLELIAKVCKVITILGGGLLLITLFATWYLPEPARDDSDPPGGRSGMMVLTDSLTGCQYLYRGSLTPRMDRNGKQICAR